jgi:hypothetical protein
MKRPVAAIAVSVLTVGTIIAAPAAANAATQVPIRTYTGQTSVYFKGIGSKQGWFTSQNYTQGVVLAPHFALSQKSVFDYGWNTHHRSTQLYDIVGNHSYTKDGSGPWSVQQLSSSALRGDGQGLNPYQAQKSFLTLPGVQRASRSHYLVTGDYAQVGWFLNYEFGVSKVSLEGTNLKIFTISFWDDSRGRLAKITMSAKSSIFTATAAETFSNYNKPLTITAP